MENGNIDDDDDDEVDCDDDDEIDTDLSDVQFEEITPADRYPCAAHDFQLCLKHSVQETLSVCIAFKKLLKLQKSFSHSQKARSALKERGKLYIKFIKIRWGTWPDVVGRYKDIRANIKQVCLTTRIFIQFFRLPGPTTSLA